MVRSSPRYKSRRKSSKVCRSRRKSSKVCRSRRKSRHKSRRRTSKAKSKHRKRSQAFSHPQQISVSSDDEPPLESIPPTFQNVLSVPDINFKIAELLDIQSRGNLLATHSSLCHNCELPHKQEREILENELDDYERDIYISAWNDQKALLNWRQGFDLAEERCGTLLDCRRTASLYDTEEEEEDRLTRILHPTHINSIGSTPKDEQHYRDYILARKALLKRKFLGSEKLRMAGKEYVPYSELDLNLDLGLLNSII